MAAPRRPPKGRPVASRGAAGRRPGRTTGRTTSTASPSSTPRAAAGTRGSTTGRTVRGASRGPSQLTRRAVILGAVVVVMLLSAAFPLQEYLQQRAEIAELEAVHDRAQDRVSVLEQERRRLQDPAFVAAEARRRLHFVLPGETAYVLVDQPPPLPGADADAPAGRDAPWFSQLWGSVREADRPTAP